MRQETVITKLLQSASGIAKCDVTTETSELLTKHSTILNNIKY